MGPRTLLIVFLVLITPFAAVGDDADERKPGASEPIRQLFDPEPVEDWRVVFTRTVVMVPMRDGIRLHTEVYQPRNQTGDLPVILERTPYGLKPDDNGFSTRIRKFRELVKDGYIFVFQDIRGRFDSEGEYVSLGPVRHHLDPEATDDSTDAWDTIEWIVNNVPDNNGRVGTLGISYGGFLTTRALVNPHPALRATSPQATCADMFVGDDWHHNGAFRLEYAFRWIASMERAKDNDIRSTDSPIARYDTYQGFLELGPLSNIDKEILHGQAPSWTAFAEHPNLDDFWTTEMCGVLPYVEGDVTVPTLNVLGWFDAEDFYGPLLLYHEYESRDVNDRNHLVIGPWFHGGWAVSDGRMLGAVDFESDTSSHYRKNIEGPWFAYWLKDEGPLDLPEVTVFQTGSNQWQEFDRWPPPDTTTRNLYLHPSGVLSFEPPNETGGDAFSSYISDPDHPVPYRHRPIRNPEGWAEWQLEDQRMAHLRSDVLTWESEPLEEDVTLTGDAVAKLFASTSGEDCDWVVKLIDVYPEDYPPNPKMGGYQMMVAGEVFRARYRNSYENPEPVAPGKVTGYTINLRDRNHRFLKGHRIMVQIQSSWFPLIDRNPQTWVDNIYRAVEEDFKAATQRVYTSRRYPTHIVLPVRDEKGH